MLDMVCHCGQSIHEALVSAQTNVQFTSILVTKERCSFHLPSFFDAEETQNYFPLQRGDRLRPEDQVLMRALRDFNIPKIVTDDMPVFMGLIGDLFPALDVPRKRDMDFEKSLIEAAVSMNLQPEAGFILKVSFS